MSAQKCWLCVLLLGLTCAGQPQGPLYVGSTDRFVFAFDEKGKVLWKTPMPEFRVWAFSDSIWLARSFEPAVLVALEPTTGKELWRWSADGKLVGVGADSIPPDCTLVACTVETAREMVHVRLRPQTGQLVASWTRRNELPWRQPRQGAACPVPPQEELIEVAFSSSAAFGFDQDAKLVWRLPLRLEEHPCQFSLRYVVLCTERGLRVLEQRSGSILWERNYPSPVQSLIGGGEDYMQVGLADGTYWQHEVATGKSFRPSQAAPPQR
ncbi:MAG: PQQ-like beta-propeller repeat protein [Calditrichaeota bacterium]|nr:PQQ-like beta-propeller repeat protein [Calditrichota bacterium]